MHIPNILALDFDGVLCDGMREYFETSRRTYVHIWPNETVPGRGSLPHISHPPASDHDRLGDALAAARYYAGAPGSSHSAELGGRTR